MKAVRVVDGEVEVLTVDGPSTEGVTVTIDSAGICGSDLHLLGWTLPVTLGHEMAGRTLDGRAVAIEPVVACGRCEICAGGDYNRCPSAVGAMFGMGRDGGMAASCTVPPEALVELPAGVSTSDACLVEPLAVAIHGVRLAQVPADVTVAVIGGGALGLCAGVAATQRGASVRVAARHDAQRIAAQRLGLGLLEEADDEVFDVVIEAAGTEAALATAAERSRAGGTILALGTYWGEPPALPALPILMKEVRIIPSMAYSRGPGGRDVDLAARLLASRPEIASALITHRFPLDAAKEAFHAASARHHGAIKVVIEP